MLYERVARPVLFRLGHGDPEVAHEWTLRRLAALSPRTREALRRAYLVPAPRTVFGVRFPNPVGLAAGMDKDGSALSAWPALGFGFVEVGTVTWHAQPGNERPRLFRLRTSEAVINRMGFNNAGARALAGTLRATGPLPVPLGISLGKSKVTLLEEAVGDYVASYRALYPYGDYVAVNVSSPNTPGLRSLQDRAHLADLLGALRQEAVGLAAAPGPDAVGPADVPGAPGLYVSSWRSGLADPPAPRPPGPGLAPSAASPPVLGLPPTAASGPGLPPSAASKPGLPPSAASKPGLPPPVPLPVAPKPIVVKIAPDLSEAAIAEVLQVCLDHGMAGVIATNTTLGRAGLAPKDIVRGGQAGGLSGRPLAARTREVVAFVHRETGGQLPIIGVGGILDPSDAVRLMDSGASLVQLYTGLIYRGPGLVRRTAKALRP